MQLSCPVVMVSPLTSDDFQEQCLLGARHTHLPRVLAHHTGEAGWCRKQKCSVEGSHTLPPEGSQL